MNIGLLRLLQTQPDAFFWPESLARSLKISPSQLIRDIHELETFGFVFDRQPHRGLRYSQPARRLCVDQIEWELGTGTIGHRIVVWQRVSSTNDVAAREASSPTSDGLVVLAEEQTAGRGRRHSAWFAPPHCSILMSVLLFVPGAIRNTPLLTSLAAVAVADVITSILNLPARIKWPNDIRLGGRKFCGILVEDIAPRRGSKLQASPHNRARIRTPEDLEPGHSLANSRATVIGIGINVNIDPTDFPHTLKPVATSLSAECGQTLDRSELARNLIQKLDQYYQNALRGDFAELWARWRELADLVGKPVRVQRPNDSLVGQLLDLRPDHALVLQDTSGTVHQISLAEVFTLQELSAESDNSV